MQCNESAYNIGTHMWVVIMNRYQPRTSTEVGDHGRLLKRKQEPCEKIQDFFITLNTAQAYMLSAGRHVDDIDLCNLVKDNVLPFHMSWTSLIDPLVTTKAELEALVFSRGVHLESKELAFRQYDRKNEPTAFAAGGAQPDDMEVMRE